MEVDAEIMVLSAGFAELRKLLESEQSKARLRQQLGLLEVLEDEAGDEGPFGCMRHAIVITGIGAS